MTIRSTAVAVPDSLEAHIRDRVTRLGRFGWAFTHVAVEIAHERNPRIADIAFIVQITCRSPRLVVRAESAAATPAVAFDACIERLHTRLRRLADKERSHRRGRLNGAIATDQRATGELLHVHDESSSDVHDEHDASADRRPQVDLQAVPLIVRDKQHSWSPMTPAEAVEAMELLGHSFYLFVDAHTGQPAVVYQRKAYTYGIVKLGERAELAELGDGEDVNHGEQSDAATNRLAEVAQVSS